MDKEGLIKDIEAYLLSEAEADEADKKEQQQVEAEKREFVGKLVDLFNTPAVKTLLEKTGAEISLFAHYGSSMGALMTGSSPDYELAVSGKGLLVKRHGKVDEEILWPVNVKIWSESIPYGGLFHDSSSGDYEWRPNIEESMQEIEGQLRSLIRKE